MDARSTYDESNEVWPFFLLTVLGLVLVPVTVTELFKVVRGQPKRKTHRQEHAQFLSRTSKNRVLNSWTFWLLVAGWAAVAALVHLARSAENKSVQAAPDVWDPYEILKIARSSTPREIRSAYRKLSLEFHPDKVKDVADQAKEQIEAVYVEISKAYRALTDEVTRENYLQFGHPDGPQPVTHGIALPAFLFNPAFAVSFVGLYLLGFGIIIPYFVGKKAVRTRRGLLLDTASQFTELLAKEQPHFITSDTVIEIVLSSADMDYALREHGGSAHLDFAERLKLLRSYLDRSEPQSHLELVVATTTSRLLIALHDMAAVFQAYLLCQRVLELRRAVLQAVPFNHLSDGEYLQLKGASIQDLDDKTTTAKSSVRESARKYLPHLELLSANFNVVGETKVTTLSQAHLTIKFLVLPLGDKPPKLTASEIAAGADFTNLKSSGFKSPAEYNATQPVLPEAVTPYFPEEVQTAWYIYLFAGPGCKLAEAPLEVTNMDLHNLKLSREQVESGDDVVIGTLILPLSSVTPASPEKIPYRVAVSSATYFGTDLKASVIMDVVRPDDTLRREASAGMEDDEDEADEVKKDDDDDDSDEEVDGPSDIDTSSEEEDNDDSK